MSCWVSLASKSLLSAWVTCLACHYWLFLIPQRVCDWQAMILVSPASETAITPCGCFQSPVPYPLPLREKVKFGPSVTDQRAGPSSWWPSTNVKMFSSPSPIICLTYSQCFIVTSQMLCQKIIIKIKDEMRKKDVPLKLR